MKTGMSFLDKDKKLPRNIYERRGYAADRALSAIERYLDITESYCRDQEKDRALLWIKAWTDFSMGQSSPRYW